MKLITRRTGIRFCSFMLIVATLLMISPVTAGNPISDEKKSDVKQSIESLQWLAGSWISETDGDIVEEQWMVPRGGLMLGLGRTVRASGRRNFEFMRIEEKGGVLTFYASPSGQPATAFKTTELAEQKIVFENPENDFPTKVTYWKDDDKLRAKIEGNINGKVESMEWTWDKVK
ncbi:MAG: hypothetical protein JNM43_13260 [Planctomycetaceae bacterium]|nr:hypothetical protein [Planctomycetaceae bacterium]